MKELKDLSVREIMVTDYITIGPEAPVRQAARLIFGGKTRKTGYKPFGIMVVDDFSHLLGMISMEDILYHLRPPFMNYEMENANLWEGELEVYLDHFTELRVEQVMHSPVITVTPKDDIIVLIDRMIKTNVRRLPVLEDEKIIGIVYLSDVFYHWCRAWLNDEKTT